MELTAYRVDFGGLWWTNRPPAVSGLNSKTTLEAALAALLRDGLADQYLCARSSSLRYRHLTRAFDSLTGGSGGDLKGDMSEFADVQCAATAFAAHHWRTESDTCR